MSSRRTAILIGAIIAGLIAVFLLYGYVKTLEPGYRTSTCIVN